VDIRFSYIPLVLFARNKLFLDEIHDRVCGEAGASIIYIEVWRKHGLELIKVVGCGCSEDRFDSCDDLRLLTKCADCSRMGEE
jgi:hypothetical protein